MMPDGYVIEMIQEQTRLKEIEDLQIRVWGMDALEVVPAAMLYIARASGGIVLGAYDRGVLAGFVLGLLGRREGRLYHASHMLGIDPAYQGRGLGAALKWRQREVALSQGLDLMTWTFDPLESRNARLNIHKLGATSATYVENLYGEMDDQLNRGLPTDRLLVEWDLRASRAAVDRAARAAAVPLFRVERGRPIEPPLEPPPGSPLLLPVPPDMRGLRDADPSASLAWRLAQREALHWAFAHGYVVRDFEDGAYLLLGSIP
ncbi:MAG TPA: GNAT family N-acetyltransferase [Chloroflexota bacterium]|nr:GNAT family N-acetyltransferase [Chloroflexota bacterium]